MWKIAVDLLHKSASKTKAEKLSVLAVDTVVAEWPRFQTLICLTPYKITPWSESVIESMLYILWDLKLKVGHSSRTINDCLRLGKVDFTIRTAMLEQRHVVGDSKLSKYLEKTLSQNLFSGSEQEFIEAKLNEREARHEKQGGQRYG